MLPIGLTATRRGMVPSDSLDAIGEQYVRSIVDQFAYFYNLPKVTHPRLTLGHILEAKKGSFGVDWSFKTAPEDIPIHEDGPSTKITAGAYLTQRRLPELYSDSEWEFLESVSANSRGFDRNTIDRLLYLSCESFWDF